MRRHTWAILLLGGLSACATAPQGGAPPYPPEPAASPTSDLLRRQIVAAQEQTARLEVKISQFSKQLKTLASVVRDLQKRQSELEGDLDRVRREIISRREPPSAPAPAPKKRGPEPAPPAKAPPAKPRKPAAAKKARKRVESVASLTPQESYNRAYRAVREKKSEEAILHFRDFLKRFPGSGLAANAQYWLGESFYDLKEYPTALEEFQKVVLRYPKSRKVPDAIFKRGLTYLRMKEPRKAALEFEKLLEEHPRHPLTEEAKEQLRTLSHSGNNLRR